MLNNTEVKERNSTICRHACFDVLRLVSAAWYIYIYIYIYMFWSVYYIISIPSASRKMLSAAAWYHLSAIISWYHFLVSFFFVSFLGIIFLGIIFLHACAGYGNYIIHTPRRVVGTICCKPVGQDTNYNNMH